VNLKFLELDLEWPSELSIFDLKNYILSELNIYGEPLRWAITSVTSHPEKENKILSVEVVFIINQDKGKNIKTELIS
tara:strand:- start:737 stop:967 length:231 start_codon:yes stop_codon:yes gene_type:complete